MCVCVCVCVNIYNVNANMSIRFMRYVNLENVSSQQLCKALINSIVSFFISFSLDVSIENCNEYDTYIHLQLRVTVLEPLQYYSFNQYIYYIYIYIIYIYIERERERDRYVCVLALFSLLFNLHRASVYVRG